MIIGDRSDSPTTVLNASCHHGNYSIHNNLSCSGDGSDSVFNFSGARKEIDEIGGTKSMHVYIYRDEIEKGVTTVTGISQIKPPCVVKAVTVSGNPVNLVSSLSHPRGGQNLCDALSIHRAGTHTRKKANSNGVYPLIISGGKNNG